LRNISVPLLGRHSVHTALRATAVGLIEGLSWEEIIIGLQGMNSQLRLVAVPGPKGSVIIDDTYNSSSESAIAALNLLADLDGRRLAILGDMLELGSYTEIAHQLVGRRAAAVADKVVAIGALGRLIGESALQAGMPPQDVIFAADALTAASLVEQLLAPGDMILVKGSRGARLDKLVTALSRD
jgi:UDP-N-acetylmuramoyl-tripeptide--D-alanyl-D-alanine ligase